jgi:hypothetical protein
MNPFAPSLVLVCFLSVAAHAAPPKEIAATREGVAANPRCLARTAAHARTDSR